MDFTHPHFAEPGWLWLAVLAPGGVVLLHRYAAWAGKKQIALFAAPELLGGNVAVAQPWSRVVKNVSAGAGGGRHRLGAGASAMGETTEVSQALGEDIVFVLDCSRSMLATDVQPNRLARAKYAILDFVQTPRARPRGVGRVLRAGISAMSAHL